MSVSELKTGNAANAETVVIVLEKLLADAKAGKIVAFAGSVLVADRVHTIPVWSSTDCISAMIGGIGFLQYAMCLATSFKEVP